MSVKICPKCGTKNVATAMYCTSCYSALRNVATSEGEPDVYVKICPKCGTESSADTVVCPHCHTPIVNVASTKKGSNEKKHESLFWTSRKTSFEQSKENEKYRDLKNNFIKNHDLDDDDDEEDEDDEFEETNVEKADSKEVKIDEAYLDPNIASHVKESRDIVFESPFIKNNEDFLVLSKDIYLFFDKDNPEVNAFAGFVLHLTTEQYKRIPIEYSNPEQPIIHLPRGEYIANKMIATAIIKFAGKDRKNLPQNIEPFADFLAMVSIVREKFDEDHDMSENVLKKFSEILPTFFPKDKENEILSLTKYGVSFVIAHELGHHAAGDIFKGHNSKMFSRTQERNADSFASRVFASIQNSSSNNMLDCFWGGLVNGFTMYHGYVGDRMTFIEKYSRKHPATPERLLNYIEDNHEIAKTFGIDKEFIKSLTDLYNRKRKLLE